MMNRDLHSRLPFLNPRLSRRKFVKLGTAAVAGLSGIAAGNFAGTPPTASANTNPIVIENQLPGVRWALDAAPQTGMGSLRAYASHTSINGGDNITFYVSSSLTAGTQITMDIIRTGWYDSAQYPQFNFPIQGSLKFTRTATATNQFTNVNYDSAIGLVQCDWTPWHTVTTSTNGIPWATGAYLARFSNPNGTTRSWVPFVVRDDTAQADFLVQCCFSTYQAYNNWTNNYQTGNKGQSLYGDPDSFTFNGRGRAYKVSFDRPYEGEGAGDYQFWESAWIRFLEREGYNVSYCSNLDVHENPNLVYNGGNPANGLRFKGLLSIGHDEYYSKEMFDTLENWRNAGLHIGFFTANEVYWKVRFESSTAGTNRTVRPNRVMVCYKPGEGGTGSTDPVTGAQTTGRFRDAPINRPENNLVGIQFDDLVDFGKGFPYVVRNANHWVWKNTGFYEGQQVRGIVGYEWDKRNKNGKEPAGLTTLSNSPVNGAFYGFRWNSESTIYQHSSGALVFAAGTIYWAYALDYNEFQDVRNLTNRGIMQATRNILEAFRTTPTIGNGLNRLQAAPKTVSTLSAASQSMVANTDVIQGRWSFGAAVTSAQPGKVKATKVGLSSVGKILSGTFNITGATAGRLVTDAGAITANVTRDGTSVRIELPEVNLTLSGTLSGEDLVAGTFSGNGTNGVWYIGRGEAAFLNFKGKHNLSIQLNNQRLGGTLKITQDAKMRHGFQTLYPQVSGELVAAGGNLPVTGLAHAGQVYLNIADRMLLVKTGDAQNGYTGAVYAIGATDDKKLPERGLPGKGVPKNGWTSTAIAQRPNLGGDWVLQMQLSNTLGIQSFEAKLRQDANGILSGTYTDSNNLVQTLGGEVDESGNVTLRFGEHSLTGSFDRIFERSAGGAYTTFSGASGAWGIKKK
jgi:hypothetical protein